MTDINPAPPGTAPPGTAPAKLKKPAVFLRLLVAACVLGGAGAAWWYWGGSPQPATSSRSRSGAGAVQAVRDAVAETGDIPIVRDALGTVTPLAAVTVHTQVSGLLQQVAFAEGQMLHQGDFLAQIDARPFEATLAQQKAAQAKDMALLGQAQSDLDRYKTLVRQDSIAGQQVEDQQFLVKQYQAAVANDQAQIDATSLNISYAHITAPITGLAGLRLVDAGNYVQPSDSSGLVVITRMQPTSVVFSIPEDDIPAVLAGLKARGALPVTVLGRDGVNQLATGKLTALNNQVDTTTGTLKLRATFDNADSVLFPNQFVNVRLLVDTLKSAVVVPNAAIQLGAAGNFVFAVSSDGTVSARPVTTGPGDGQRTSIAKGLAPGEHVVIDGTDRLRDGARVLVHNDAAAAQGAAAPAAIVPHTAPDAGAATGTPVSGAAAPGADASAPGTQGEHKHRHRPPADGSQTADPAADASHAAPAAKDSP